nr:hypothetical protein RKYZRHPG_RKYZRHPG_CDS_0011 [uncultured phage]
MKARPRLHLLKGGALYALRKRAYLPCEINDLNLSPS